MSANTQIIKVNPYIIKRNKLKQIATVLKNEGVIIYPTETFYGIGANFYSSSAVKKIYTIKKRDPSKPISAVVSDLEMLEEMTDNLPPLFYSLASSFWPGPLTLVLKASSKLPPEHLGSSSTVGVRLPDFPWLRELIKEASFPLTATSANISGEKEISKAEEAKKIFWNKVDLIVDGGRTKGTKPSTVVDLTSETPVILRKGAISPSRLKEYLT